MTHNSDVEFDDAGDSLTDDDSRILRKCEFCDKETLVYLRTGELIGRLLRPNRFFCSFCIRHDFHTRKGKDILILSMRSIIAYIYYNCYYTKEATIFVSEIEDMIEEHISVGLLNPIFVYDYDTFCWFVDFAKVGNKGRVLNVGEVINTVNEIICCFNPYENIGKDFKGHKFVEKFKDAIIDFYKRRCRPEGRKRLIPTLQGCVGVETNVNKKQTTDYREFNLIDLKLHSRR